MADLVTALEARRIRLLARRPLSEVDRCYERESLCGFAPRRLVPAPVYFDVKGPIVTGGTGDY